MVHMTDRGKGSKRRDLRGTARRSRILAMLEADPGGDLSVEEIAESFDVSHATVRRDLARLGAESGVARTYGGIALVSRVEVPTRERETARSAAKDAIGKAAARRVHDGDTIIVDAGSTTTRLTKHLAECQGITVITNGVGVITSLLDRSAIEVIVLGGRLRGINETITGPEAEEMLRHVYAATAFMGTDAIDETLGLASRTMPQSRLKSLMMRRAAEVVVLADSTKLRGGPLNFWSALECPWRLITDDEASEQDVERVRRAGAIEIEVAEI